MSITATLMDKDLTAVAKLESVAKVVTALRKSYGNSEAKVADVKVNTTHGMLPFSNLEPESKVELLLNQAQGIKAKAIAAVEDTPSFMLDKEVERMIATNAMFANASSKSAFSVL